MDRAGIQAVVREAIESVRTRGDAALLEFAERWDKVRLRPEDLRVPREAIEAAPVDTPFARAYARAVERIRRFHERVRPESLVVEDPEGARMALRWTPIRSAGLYVPGGTAGYPSTLAMTAVPAQVAGVERIAVASPPGPGGEVAPEVLVGAKLLGIAEIYRVGGAQAIAALALGTQTIPRVDKIFGPGNAFVTEAKRQLFGEVGIDLFAGPSELVVYADPTADPDWVAADLLAQAEHDAEARVTLLATSASIVEAVRASVCRLAASEPRRDVIERAIAAHGRFEVVGSDEEAAARIDEIAPEHLSLQVARPERVIVLVRNAGAIYVGGASPVAAGDYYAGPNHVLPTGAAARYASALSVEDFLKRSNVVELAPEFISSKGEDIETLALAEGLPAHAASVRLRRRKLPRARPGLRTVPPYLLVEEEGEVKLNQNESPWDVPAELKDEVAARLRGLSWNRYHQRIPGELISRIATDSGFPPEAAIAASGSNLVLQWVFSAFCPPGGTIVIPSPSFSLYALWAEVCEARTERVPLGPKFEYDAELFAAAVRSKRPALAVLCLPNNPTGSEMPPDGVRRVAEACAEVGAALVVDEAYREFTEPEFDRSRLALERPNVFLVRTFSKAFAAAGLRLGYLFGPPSLVSDLRKLVPPFHLNLFAAVFGLAAWEKKAFFLERVRRMVEERDRLARALAKIRGVEVFPTHANFFLVRVPDPEALARALKARGILVRLPGKDPALSGFLRVNAGTPEEDDRLVAAVKEILEGAEG